METGTEALARVNRLAAGDPFVRSLGIKCVDGGPGRAAVRMRIKPVHMNFNGTCHGGVVFALADTSFGLAANSHGKVAAGIDAHVTYQTAVKAGDLLTATATEVSRTRRLAVYRVDVTRADGTLVATFTGTVYILDKHTDS
jgi:phenylacetic acid degradation protein PaaD